VRSRRSSRARGWALPLTAVAAATVAGALLLAGPASPAGAHATLVGTVPAADAVVDAVPSAVELQFDEPVEALDDAVRVFGPGGERADVGTVETADGGATLRAPLDADATGTYTVAWRVTSEDSHTLTGSFVFHNGTQTGAVEVSDSGGGPDNGIVGGIGRWLGLAGTIAAVGAAALALLRSGGPRTDPATPALGDGFDPTAPASGAGNGDATDAAGPGGGNGDAAPRGLGGDGTGTDAGADRAAGAVITPRRGSGALAAGGSGAPAGGVGAPPGGAAAGTLTAAEVRVAERADGALALGTGPAALAVSPAVDAPSALLRTLTVAGALAGAVGAFVTLVAVLAHSVGRGLIDAVSLVTDVAPDSRTGQLALVRIALALAAAAAAAVAPLWRRSPLPALALAAGSRVATSLAGHAWTAPDRGIAVTADLAHLGAVAVWVGGVVALLAVLPLETRDGRVRLATRFSGLALAAAVVVAVSGTVSGWQQVRTLDGLTSTTYGRLLLAKVAGFVVLVVVGWVNRSRLVPLVGRTVAPLQRSLRVETLVAAVVLAVTAALIHQPPARTEATSGPFDTSAVTESAAAPGARVDATVDPAQAGNNDIHLFFYAGEGTEPLTVDAVQVTAATTDVPARRLQVTPVTTNHVTVAGASLPSAGTWTIEVTAVRAGEPLVFTLEVPIA
jgi:copper transport protein